MVHYISDFIGRRLREIQAEYPDWLVGIRQNGVVIGLEFAHPQGAKYVMRHLYDNGVWAIFSTLDPRVLQYKPGLLFKPELAEELLDRTEVAIGKATARFAESTACAGRCREMTETFDLAIEPHGVPRGRAMIERAEWASRAFATLRRGDRAPDRRSRRRGGR